MKVLMTLSIFMLTIFQAQGRTENENSQKFISKFNEKIQTVRKQKKFSLYVLGGIELYKMKDYEASLHFYQLALKEPRKRDQPRITAYSRIMRIYYDRTDKKQLGRTIASIETYLEKHPEEINVYTGNIKNEISFYKEWINWKPL